MFLAKKFLFLVLLALVPAIALAEPAGARLLAEGNVDQAIASLRAQIKDTPNDAASYHLLCRAYFTLGNWDQGASACEKAVALDPGNSQYHMWLGRVYGEKASASGFFSAAGLAKKVRTEFETAVRLNPNNVEARTDLAEFYLEAPGIVGGGRDKAETQARTLAAQDAAKADWVNGRLAEKKKDFVTAEIHYRAAVLATQGSADAWLNLAFFYRHVGRLEDMQDAIRRASSAEARQSVVLMEAAEVLIRAGRDFPLAKQLLGRYLSQGSDQGSDQESSSAFKAHYLLGTILEKQGDKSSAAQQYRTALSLAKGFNPAQKALDRISPQLVSLPIE
jgi:tetratricopeptide (TPR) repeat protein